MTAFYNEIDPKAAAWLRELIAGGHIAPGIVDERDIRDIRPDELLEYAQCHFFAGIGGWSLALRRAGWPDDRPVWTGSCPCQPFSSAGKRGGTDDERHLWPAFYHLIEQCRPPVVFGEQVASKDGLGWFDLVSADLEGSGYAVGAADLCAAGLGAPHIRQRLWFVGVADATDARLQVGRAGQGWTPGSVEQPERLRSSHGVADPLGERGRGGELGREDAGDARVTGQAVRLADGHSDGREPGRSLQPLRAEHDAEHGGAVSRVADAERGLSGRRPGEAPSARDRSWRVEEPGHHGSVDDGANRRPGPVNGFWRDADWLFCRDGKWRPVEPGTFPLAHGIPGRVGLLRGYGNAIVPEVAQAFIEAVMA